MGWTCSYVGGFQTRNDRKDYLDKNVFHWSDGSRKVLQSSMVGSVYYGAIQEVQTGKVFAVIALTSYSSKDSQFCYKDMSEDCGPYETSCPQKILKLLTPTDNEYAIKWRESCKKKFTKAEDFSVGQKIKFSESFNCSGVATILSKAKSSWIIVTGDGTTIGDTFKVSTAKLKSYIDNGMVELV